MPKKPNEIITTTSIRLPADLKEKCEFLSKRDGLSFNEWVKRTLGTICDAFIVYHKTDKNKMISVFESLDDYLKYDNENPNIKTRADFIKEGCGMLFLSEHCPNCGALIPYESNYCFKCGELIYWEHPDTQFFNVYFEEYVKAHPLPTGWSYGKAYPSKNTPDTGFSIFKMQNNTSQPFEVVKIIHSADLDSIKKRIQEKEAQRHI